MSLKEQSKSSLMQELEQICKSKKHTKPSLRRYTESERNIGKTGTAKDIAMSPVNPDKVMVGFLGLWPTKQLYYTHNAGDSVVTWKRTDTMDDEMTGPEFEGEDALSPWVVGSLFSGGWTQDLSGSGEWTAPIAFHPTEENTAIMAGHGEEFSQKFSSKIF